MRLQSGGKSQGLPVLGNSWLIVAVFALAVALAGVWTLPPLDRDEARFAQATVQMLESDDFISIRFQEDERNKKPAGIHWFQAASVSVLSDVKSREIWAYRLPSVLGGLLAAVFTYFAAAKLYDRQTGLVAGLLLAAAPVVAAETTIAKTDAMLLALICLTQLGFIQVLARIQEGRSGGWRWPALFWITQGLAILVKGPIGPMVSLLTGIGLAARRPRFSWITHMRPISGFLLLALIVFPWAVAIGIETEGRFFIEALGGDMFGKLREAQESHGAPPGYHAGLVWVLFWPAAALILPGLLELWRARATWQALFLFSWLIPAWFVFELSATKLPHYTLPLYPALAIIAARAVITPPENRSALLQKTGAVVYGLVGIGAAALVLALPLLYANELPGLLIFGGAGATAIASGFIAVWFWRGRRLRGALAAALLAGLYVWLLMGVSMPSLSKLSISQQLSEVLESAERHPIRDNVTPVALAGYNEPSAVFLLGSETRLTSGEAAAYYLLAGNVSAAIIERRHAEAFQMRLDEQQDKVRALAVIDGLNYSNGNTVSLTVYVRTENQAQER